MKHGFYCGYSGSRMSKDIKYKDNSWNRGQREVDGVIRSQQYRCGIIDSEETELIWLRKSYYVTKTRCWTISYGKINST